MPFYAYLFPGQRLVGRRQQRRTSEANSLPTPIISPPLSISEVVFSPLSTFSLPLPLPNLATNSPAAALHIKKEPSSAATQPPQRLSVSGFDTDAELSMDNCSEVILLDSSSCKTEIQEKGGTVGGGTVGGNDVMIKNDDIIDGADKTLIQSQPLIKVSHLSDDSDSDTSEGERIDRKILSPSPKKRWKCIPTLKMWPLECCGTFTIVWG